MPNKQYILSLRVMSIINWVQITIQKSISTQKMNTQELYSNIYDFYIIFQLLSLRFSRVSNLRVNSKIFVINK
jgi:hypothetical protein